MIKLKNASFQVKRGTAQRWIEVDPILLDGEPGYEYDTYRIKIGDGKKRWSELPYLGGSDIGEDQKIYPYDSLASLPTIGDSNKLYHVVSEKMIYSWNPSTKEYDSLDGGGIQKINLINGGNAND